jgi:hypothetical protein
MHAACKVIALAARVDPARLIMHESQNAAQLPQASKRTGKIQQARSLHTCRHATQQSIIDTVGLAGGACVLTKGGLDGQSCRKAQAKRAAACAVSRQQHIMTQSPAMLGGGQTWGLPT